MTWRKALLIALVFLTMITLACTGDDPLGGNGGQGDVNQERTAVVATVNAQVEATMTAMP